MSLRFFTHTKVGELMSRLNNDVVGAQNAISNTFVNILTNLVQAIAVLVVMFTLEWRLTLISVAIMPLFILAARRLGTVLRDIARDAMDANAKMNAMMNETLNIGGAILVKLFGRTHLEVQRFESARCQCPGYRYPPGNRGDGILRHHRLDQRSRDGTCVYPGRLPGHPGCLYHRHHRRIRRLPDQPVLLSGRAGKCSGGVRHFSGQLRARVRSH